jgi:hypothetical protein
MTAPTCPTCGTSGQKRACCRPTPAAKCPHGHEPYDECPLCLATVAALRGAGPPATHSRSEYRRLHAQGVSAHPPAAAPSLAELARKAYPEPAGATQEPIERAHEALFNNASQPEGAGVRNWRTFWIDNPDFDLNFTQKFVAEYPRKDSLNGTELMVIEYAAYERVKTERDEARKSWLKLSDVTEQLRAECAGLRALLERVLSGKVYVGELREALDGEGD